MRHEDHSKLIDLLGGTVEVSRLCHVSSQAVSKWRKEGIPDARMMFLRLARPDVFGDQPSDVATTQAPPGTVVIPVVTPERRAEDRRGHERRDGERRDSERQGAKGAA